MWRRLSTYFGANLLTLGLGAVTLPVATRLMTPDEFGLAGILLGLVAIAVPGLSMGAEVFLPAARARHGAAPYQEDRSVVYSASALAALLCSTTALLSQPWTGRWSIPLAIAPLIAMTRGLRQAEAGVLSYLHEDRRYALGSVVLAVSGLLLTLVLLSWIPSSTSRMVAVMTSEGLALLFFLWRSLPLSFRIERQALGRCLRVSGPLLLTALPAWFLNEYGKVHLARLGEMALSGTLAVCFQLGYVQLQLNNAFGNVLNRSLYDDIDRCLDARANLRTLSMIAGASCIIGTLLWVVAQLVFDARYQGIADILPIVLAGFAVQSCSLLPATYANFYHRTDLRLASVMSGAVINVFTLLVTNSSGNYGVCAAYAFLAGMTTYTVSCYILMHLHAYSKKDTH